MTLSTRCFLLGPLLLSLLTATRCISVAKPHDAFDISTSRVEGSKVALINPEEVQSRVRELDREKVRLSAEVEEVRSWLLLVEGRLGKAQEKNTKLQEENKKLQEENKKLQEENKKLQEENRKLKALQLQGAPARPEDGGGRVEEVGSVEDGGHAAAADADAAAAAAASGRRLLAMRESRYAWLGYKCEATSEDMWRYNNYSPHLECPNDWFFVQRLIYLKNCFALPRRRCRTTTPVDPVEPLPFPQSLFDQRALDDRSVRWDLHQCKNFECLNVRPKGDCLRCFNMSLEEERWKRPYRGTIPMKEVIDMKKGTLRLGLDVGGGTGSFAAHMARYGVTVMTSAYNVETVGKNWGLAYMETIALRGLIPLHVSHHARLPLYHGTLDVIHAVNTVKAVTLMQLEEIVYEWDRVLRAGGILWLEMFYAPEDEMPKYVKVIDRLKYKRLYWNFTPKPDGGEWGGANHVYLNCVLEKQPFPGSEFLDGPPAEDTKALVEYHPRD